MKILIKEVAKSQWQVRLDQHVVTFRTEAEAQAFASTLQARILAPIISPNNSSARPAESALATGLGQGPGILQATGQHRGAHHQQPAKADDQRHWHGGAVMQRRHQRGGSGGHGKLQASQHRRSTAGPGALPIHGASRGVGKDATQAGDADKQRDQQRPQLRRLQ